MFFILNTKTASEKIRKCTKEDNSFAYIQAIFRVVILTYVFPFGQMNAGIVSRLTAGGPFTKDALVDIRFYSEVKQAVSHLCQYSSNRPMQIKILKCKTKIIYDKLVNSKTRLLLRNLLKIMEVVYL